MTRNEAVAWLRSMGWDAEARDWTMGETIVFPIGETTIINAGTGSEIGMYPGAIYLYPDLRANGHWHLWDHDVPDPAESYEDLESAIRGAHEYATRKQDDPGSPYETTDREAP